MRRVVITGQGAVSALGHTAPTTMEGMREGRCAIGPLEMRDVERLSIGIGGQVRSYDEKAHFTRQELTFFDRFTQFALIAGQEAMTQSGLEVDEETALRAGCVVGTSGGGLHTVDDNYRTVYEEGKNRVHPFVVPRLMNNAAASHLSMKHDLRGPSFTVATACASSNHAMGQAFHMIQSGMADVMLTGGSESMLVFGGIKAWEGLRVMSKDGCRPFCKTRNGMVQGEGAAIFVFEEYERARARGADILAEVVGFAMSADASDIVMPNSDGAQRAMAGALQSAGINADEVGYINAHGTGTAANDRTECAAVRAVFGDHADRLMISSTKSMHGHLIGGTGAVELLACIMALRDGVIAPTANHVEGDPECDLDVVPNEARDADVSVVLTNAFAFGGLNAVLALRKV
ncbi:beta-ketoacyl-[acyl-carrier-protein] synthase family protein [Pontivivens insulae]|uniref:Nodulation protein E n=1 Tax=Pontivivens insulae TaxID=1639689 RepID=A0A2R8AC48_9RHOB|nr:beta-ketoacyl-[acyl-carrier-protein] synthase family protein [Pontivivens insulae]RED11207.1 3-oxoacyl-[acyl-carrier-protein] synthase II [Pontivivens insulae]SPF29620.1 3-oxoacyl-[acyl-carrier-protein] synthase 2 [Pontivivens insulae]